MRPVGSEPITQCPRCEGEAWLEQERTLQRTVGGRVFERVVPALVCEACYEGFLSAVDLAAFERQVGAEVIALGLEAPDAVAWVLDGYGLEPEVIGATWREVKAWGRGEAPVPAGVWPALRSAVEGAASGAQEG